MPEAWAEPIPSRAEEKEVFAPLEEQEASYFAASPKIKSFSRISKKTPAF